MYRFENQKHKTNARRCHNTLHTMAIAGGDGKAAAAWHIAQVAAASLRVRVHGGRNAAWLGTTSIQHLVEKYLVLISA